MLRRKQIQQKQLKFKKIKTEKLFFAVFYYKHIVIERFHKIVLTESGVVKVDEIFEMLIDKHGIGRVELMTNISQPQFVIGSGKFLRRSVYQIFRDFIVFHKSCPNFHILRIYHFLTACQAPGI